MNSSSNYPSPRGSQQQMTGQIFQTFFNKFKNQNFHCNIWIQHENAFK